MTYEHFADRDPRSRAVLEQMLAGVSTRHFQRTREPAGEQLEHSHPGAAASLRSAGRDAKPTPSMASV